MKTSALLTAGLLTVFLFSCKSDPKTAPEELPAKASGATAAENTPAKVLFSDTLGMQNTTFRISATEHDLNIEAAIANFIPVALDTPISGSVTEAAIEDLDADGWPEVMVFTRRSDGDMRAEAYAFTTLENGTLAPVYLPPLESDPAHMEGYVGGDEFAVVETSLIRRMVLEDGSVRQLQYTLGSGENGKAFYVDKVVEY